MIYLILIAGYGLTTLSTIAYSRNKGGLNRPGGRFYDQIR